MRYTILIENGETVKKKPKFRWDKIIAYVLIMNGEQRVE